MPDPIKLTHEWHMFKILHNFCYLIILAEKRLVFVENSFGKACSNFSLLGLLKIYYVQFCVMPRINILVHTTKTLKTQDSASEGKWMTRKSRLLGEFDYDRSDFEPASDISTFSFVSCQTRKYRAFENINCQITNLKHAFSKHGLWKRSLRLFTPKPKTSQ